MTKKYWKTLKKLSLTMLITMLFLVSISIPMNIQPNNTIINNIENLNNIKYDSKNKKLKLKM